LPNPLLGQHDAGKWLGQHDTWKERHGGKTLHNSCYLEFGYVWYQSKRIFLS